jgi:trigger factor
MSAGETGTFRTELAGGGHAGEEADVTVTVHSVKVKELPELDDEFAQSASEFDTLDELRESTRNQLSAMRRGGQAEQARDRALDAVLEQVDIPLPEDLITGEIDVRRQALEDRIARSGLDRAAYLEAAGSGEEQLEEEFGTDARRAVKAGFVLDKLAVAEKLGVDQNELGQYVAEQAYRMGVAPDRLAKELADRNQLNSVVADLLRSKALNLLAQRATVKDASGRPVDLSMLSPAADGDGEAAPDGDGDQVSSAE